MLHHTARDRALRIPEHMYNNNNDNRHNGNHNNNNTTNIDDGRTNADKYREGLQWAPRT